MPKDRHVAGSQWEGSRKADTVQAKAVREIERFALQEAVKRIRVCDADVGKVRHPPRIF